MCETRHVGLVLKGRLHVVTKDGAEFDVGKGNVIDVPPGHDAWVVSDEALVTVTWMGPARGSCPFTLSRKGCW